MFSMSSFVPHKGPVGTIRVSAPIRRIGDVVDVDGTVWNVRGMSNRDGKAFVWATPVNHLHKYYTDTSGMSFAGQYISQSWEPYYVEIVDETVGISGETGNTY
jgi:hypothetical protein